MMPVVIGLPAPCPGAFDCVLEDIHDLVSWPGTIIGSLVWVVLFVLLWRTFSKKEVKSRWMEGVLYSVLTALAFFIFLLFYSPKKQYENIRGQYEDAVKRLETSEAIIKQTRLDMLTQQSSFNVQSAEKIKEIQNAIKSLQDTSDEILRNVQRSRVK